MQRQASCDIFFVFPSICFIAILRQYWREGREKGGYKPKNMIATCIIFYFLWNLPVATTRPSFLWILGGGGMGGKKGKEGCENKKNHDRLMRREK